MKRIVFLPFALLLATACSSDSPLYEEERQEPPVPQLTTRSGEQLEDGATCDYLGLTADGSCPTLWSACYQQTDATTGVWQWDSDTDKRTGTWDGTAADAITSLIVALPHWKLTRTSISGSSYNLTQTDLATHCTDGLMLGKASYPLTGGTTLSANQLLARLEINWVSDYAMNPSFDIYTSSAATLNFTPATGDILTDVADAQPYSYTLTDADKGGRRLHLPIFPQTFTGGALLFAYSIEKEGVMEHHFYRLPEGKDYTVGKNQQLRVNLLIKAEAEEVISTVGIAGINVNGWEQGTTSGGSATEESAE